MSADPDVTLDEMRSLLLNLPGPDLEARTAATLRRQELSRQADTLGLMDELPIFLATWMGKYPAEIRHPRIAIFAASHGIATHFATSATSLSAEQSIADIIAGGAAINYFSEAVDADLRVYEMALDLPTTDFTIGPAMSESDCARAMAYGMMAVETGIDLLALGEIGTGNHLSAAALCLALFGGQGSDWVASSIDGDLIEQAVELHRPDFGDKFDILRRLGGLELAAIVGAILAARRGRVPVVLDGFASTAAAAVLFAADPRSLAHCVAGQRSNNPTHGKLLAILGQRPLLDLEIGLGQGIGAALAIGIIKTAAAAHAGMVPYEDV